MFSNHSKSLTLVSLNIGSKNSNKSSSSKAKINPYKKKPSKCLNKRLTSSVSTEVRLVLCASVEWCLAGLIFSNRGKNGFIIFCSKIEG